MQWQQRFTGLHEPWTIADVAKEELLFEASVGVGECTALKLEYWGELFAGCDHGETCKEVVARTMMHFIEVRVLQKILPSVEVSLILLLKDMMR